MAEVIGFDSCTSLIFFLWLYFHYLLSSVHTCICEYHLHLYHFIYYKFFISKIFKIFSFHHRFTASHHAALTGSSEVVIGLIELESDINARDHKGDWYFDGGIMIGSLLINTLRSTCTTNTARIHSACFFIS